MDPTKTTIVKVFFENSVKYADQPLIKYWRDESWQNMTWTEYGSTVQKLSSGLLSLGIKKGDRVCIMSNTRAEWGMADLAILAIGGVTGCIYPTLLGKDVAYIIDDLKAEAVFVESMSQLDVLMSCKDRIPGLKHIILIDGGETDHPAAMSWPELLLLGTEKLPVHIKIIEETIETLDPKEVATVVYTSGTTGIPKGAVHDHLSIMYTVANDVYPFEPGMTDLSYLPLAHVFERFGGFFVTIYRGNLTIGYFRGDMKGLFQDFYEIKPHVNRTAPRLLEKIYSAVMAIVAAKSEPEQHAFQHALALAKKIRVEEALYGKPVSAETRKDFEGAMALKPFDKIYHMLGGNLTFFYCGGASVPREVIEFFFAIDIPVYELYGTSETIGTVTNYPGRTRPGTIGVSFPMLDWSGRPGQTRLSPDGEIQNTGPNVLLEYLNQPEKTQAAFTEDGWFKTGDLGFIDKDGFITITGRKKDIIVTSGGKNIAPQKIENMMMETGYFSQVLVYGDNRKYLVALLTLDPMMIQAIVMKLDIDLPGNDDAEDIYQIVSSDPKTREFIQTIIDKTNGKLFKQEQIVNFILLDRDLQLELDEITPTMKIKKKNVIDRFRKQLDSLYH